MLATRLSQLSSCDSKEFCKAVPEYVEAMHRSGHTGNLRKTKREKETSHDLTHRLASTSKPTSARNSCDCSLNITNCTKSATNSTLK